MTKGKILSAIIKEYQLACNTFPLWPADPIHCAAIIGEEAGEILAATIDHQYPYCNKRGDVALERAKKEAIQTAAMCIRFLENLEVKNPAIPSKKWFGKDCEYLAAQWEGNEYSDGPDYKESEPILKFCDHVDNPNDREGNCNPKLCPLGLKE